MNTTESKKRDSFCFCHKRSHAENMMIHNSQWILFDVTDNEFYVVLNSEEKLVRKFVNIEESP